MKKKEHPKLYTLEEAYAEISKLKKEMGFPEYLKHELYKKYWKGYEDGINKAKEMLDKIIIF